MVAKAFQVPGLPLLTHTQPAGAPETASELNTMSPSCALLLPRKSAGLEP
jgi:hypothetical protein